MTISILYGTSYDDGGCALRMDCATDRDGVEDQDKWLLEKFNGKFRMCSKLDGRTLTTEEYRVAKYGETTFMIDFETQEEASIFMLSI